MGRLNRRTQHERLGERMPTKRTHWLKLFPGEKEIVGLWAKVKRKIETKIVKQKQEEAQKIGAMREEKVKGALEALTLKGKIPGYFHLAPLSQSDLIKGVDFAFVVVNGQRKFCYFSVTGKDWVQKHLQRHPEIPVLTIDLQESQESIEEKILALKNAEKNTGLKKK